MNISCSTFGDGWIRLLRRVYEEGIETAPRGLKIREAIATRLVVHGLRQNILVHPDRDLNYRFVIAEWLWMLAGRNDVATVARYNRQIEKFSDNGVTFEGAYGPRLLPQWNYLLRVLQEDPDSRQAVATIWTPRPPRSKDIPCTIAVQFLIREGLLHSIWTMRSNDLWLGTPHDFFNFSQLTNCLAAELGRPCGSLTLQVGSTHIYESNFEAVETVLANEEKTMTLESPALECWPNANAILNFAANVNEDLTPSAALTAPRIELAYARALACKNKSDALKELMRLSETQV